MEGVATFGKPESSFIRFYNYIPQPFLLNKKQDKTLGFGKSIITYCILSPSIFDSHISS